MTVDHTDPEESYLTVAEVAQTLKLNQQTVRNWIDQGSLPALRVGRRVRIKRSDFERILEESYSGGRASSTAGVPSADDFWGGEPVGLAEPSNSGPDGARAPEPIGGSNPLAPSTPTPSTPKSGTPAA
jgi:excisionase family DNA binding protein